MDLDAFLISRLQFAFTIIWHIIFPPFTIGLSAYIATLCVMWMRTGKEHYRELARFWTKIFVINSPLLLARARPNTVVESSLSGVVFCYISAQCRGCGSGAIEDPPRW
jgi:hypothetical protein